MRLPWRLTRACLVGCCFTGELPSGRRFDELEQLAPGKLDLFQVAHEVGLTQSFGILLQHFAVTNDLVQRRPKRVAQPALLFDGVVREERATSQSEYTACSIARDQPILRARVSALRGACSRTRRRYQAYTFSWGIAAPARGV